MDLQNFDSGLDFWVRELNFTIYSAWTQQGRVQDVDSVCGHDDLDCLRCLEPVQLIQQLKHSSLDLRVTPLALHSGSTNRIHLVDKDDTG